MHKINEIINYLKSSPYHVICVKNKEFKNTIVHNLTGEEIENEFGSYQDFFQKILEENTNVSVDFRKKNGSSFKAVKSIDLGVAQNQQENTQNLNNAMNNNQNSMMGLMGGLNMMDISYKYQDHQRLSIENEVLRNENKELKAKVDELKEKVMLYDVKRENSSNTKELINGIAPLLAPILTKLAAPSSGLNAPQGGTALQNQAIQTVMQLDDQTLHYWLLIAQNFNNQEFVNQMFDLMQKFNLIPKKDDE